MHTEAPPKEIIEYWLENYPSKEGRYGHILLEQKCPSEDKVREGLRPYFESAHADARDHFHAFAGISLHPDSGAAGCNAKYPNCLPTTTRRGLFGEVLSGLMTEALDFIGEHEWTVPIFLFRHQEDVQQYIYTLSRDSTRTREIYGRKGDDFIGIVVGDDGRVTRFIAGESKWRQTWNDSTLDRVMLGDKIKDPKDPSKRIHNGKGVWFELNRALKVPMGVRQLQLLLQELAPDDYSSVILSLDRILQLENPEPTERTDLILLAGGSAAGREAAFPLIPWKNMPAEYTAGRDLQVVEVLLTDGEQLIDALYDGLWP